MYKRRTELIGMMKSGLVSNSRTGFFFFFNHVHLNFLRVVKKAKQVCFFCFGLPVMWTSFTTKYVCCLISFLGGRAILQHSGEQQVQIRATTSIYFTKWIKQLIHPKKRQTSFVFKNSFTWDCCVFSPVRIFGRNKKMMEHLNRTLLACILPFIRT